MFMFAGNQLGWQDILYALILRLILFTPSVEATASISDEQALRMPHIGQMI